MKLARILSGASIFLAAKALVVKGGQVSDREGLHEITNEDTSLDVVINPPIRLNIFETSPFISESTVRAIVNATSTFATTKLSEYFLAEHGDTYLFDRVNFEATSVESIVRGDRRLRSFEREEGIVRNTLRQERGMGGSEIRTINVGNERVTREEEYGTSVVLRGNITFAFLPAAPPEECNRILAVTMQRHWGLNQAIKMENNAELAKVTTQGLSTELLTPEPTTPPTESPTSSPTRQPTASPSKRPSVEPTNSPTDRPTKSPTDKPSLGPTIKPSISKNPTWTDAPSLTPSISVEPSRPRPTYNGIITDRQKGRGVLLPVIIATIIAFVLLVIGGFYLLKRHREKQSNPKLLRHDKLLGDANDYDLNPNNRMLDGPDDLVGITSTKEDSLDSGNESADSRSGGDVDANRGLSFENSVASGSTLKTTNVFSNENNWLESHSSGLTKGSFIASAASGTQKNASVDWKKPSSDHIDIESQKKICESSSVPLAKGSFDAVSQRKSDIPPVGPGPKSLAGIKDGKSSLSSPNNPSLLRVNGSSSPVITVTPSKVSEEEFGKDWDVDLPFNWKPTPEETSYQKPTVDNEHADEMDIDGSFPTFEMVDDPPAPTRPKNFDSNMENSYTTSSRSNADSSFYTSTGLHPQDWSNKGSENDGTSIGGSTLTEGDGHISFNERRFDWHGSSPNRSGHTSGGAYLTPMSGLTRHTNVPFTATSGISPRSLNASSIESSPSSRGSGKQLINDLVWLEKKIADVRARVDKLDGDESQTTGSPPVTPSTVEHKTIGSPITANCGIVCRDIIAPPGKLQITIHSTKDGPAIHSVKQGSILEGHLFAGDLIVAVDDTDTRSWSAEDVMGIMSQNSSKERKLTVLHAS